MEPDSLAAKEFARFDENVKQILADMFVDMSLDAGEKLSTIHAAGLGKKITAQKDGVKNKAGSTQALDEASGKPTNNVSSYSYDVLIKKPNMRVVDVGGTVPDNRTEIVAQAKKNAAKVGKADKKTDSVSVRVADIDTDVVLGTVGLKHGLDRRNKTIGLVTLKAGEILQSSIRINELVPKKDNVEASYVLIGMARTDDGELYVVRSLVNRYNHKLTSMDVLYAINAKKGNRLRSMRPGFQGPVTDSTISISDLLDYVNEYFPDILPEDVLKQYGYDRRPEGDLGMDALYKSPVRRDYSDRAMLADMFEQMVTNSKEHKALENYRKQMDEMLEIEEHLERVTAEIRRLSFAEGPRDTETLKKLKLQQKQAINRLNNYDNILLRLEKSGVLKAMIERNSKKVTQERIARAKEYYRERNERRESEIRQYYRESRRQAVERHDKAEIRKRIRMRDEFVLVTEEVLDKQTPMCYHHAIIYKKGGSTMLNIYLNHLNIGGRLAPGGAAQWD